ncbi:alpha/beta hydrolase [Amycolatopsis antarctica]|uniref:Alpha/beta hydrolase n=1 Tax=Amycolatopsis antarctica TaxID=1854586 RepID=A0A263DCC0_9PSEU|nr:alpha/beta fold hydrolase [Amycolatopsis antarctica]OZM75147.1 alpha/beta hydrolase [Amycolatopsis antarctica]
MSATPLPALDMTIPPFDGERAEVEGLSLHIRRTPGADGAQAVYVHGLGGSSTNWTDLAAQLAPFASGVAPDLPGFGFSEPASDFAFSLDAHAEVLATFVEGLGAGPVHLLGNSMGGAISLLLAARRPELVRTLTLISPAMPDLRPDPRRLSDPLMALAYLPVVGRGVRRRLAAQGPRERARQVIDLCYADPEAFPEHRLDELAAEHAERAAFRWAAPALSRSTFGILRTWLVRGERSLWAAAPKVRAPTLVVWGTQDRIITVRRAMRTARLLPRGRLLVLPRTGHTAQMERPVTVAKAVLGMWEAVERDRW